MGAKTLKDQWREDLSWFSLLLMGAGGLSVLDIIERGVVLHDLGLITPLQMLVDGYQRIVGLLGVAIGPVVTPIIEWVSSSFHLELTLSPVWQPLFCLLVIPGVSIIRATLKAQDAQLPVEAPPQYKVHLATEIVDFTWWSMTALIASLVVAVIPNASEPHVQGYGVAIPIALLILSVGTQQFTIRRQSSAFFSAVNSAVGGALFGFWLGFALAHIPGMKTSAAIAGNAIVVLLMGVFFLFADSAVTRATGRRLPQIRRAAFLILGGFVAAGLLLVADMLLKALGVD